MAVLDKILTVSIRYLQKKQKDLRRKKKRKKKKKARQKKKRPKRTARKKVSPRGSPRRKKKDKRGSVRKKKPAKKKASQKKKPARKKRPAKKRTKPKAQKAKTKRSRQAKSAPKEERVGEITHYFSRIEVVVVKITKGKLCVGDKIRIRGRTSDFTQTVRSLQIESVDVKEGRKGQLVGLKVAKKAKEGDQVFVLK